MADQPKYSVDEIDALRRCGGVQIFIWHVLVLRSINGYGNGGAGGNGGVNIVGRSYTEIEKVTVVEQQVRTFMLNGTKAEELIASCKK